MSDLGDRDIEKLQKEVEEWGPIGEREISSSEIIQQICLWISQGHKIEDVAQKVITRLLVTHDNRIMTAMYAVSLHKMQRLSKFMEAAEVIDEELFSEDRIREASMYELIRVRELVNKLMNDSEDYLQRMVDSNKVPVEGVFDNNVTINQTNINLNAQEREVLRDKIWDVLNSVKEQTGATKEGFIDGDILDGRIS